MGQNGIPRFYFFIFKINKKSFFAAYLFCSNGKRGVCRLKTAANYKYGYTVKQIYADVTMMEVNLKQVLLLRDGCELETDAVARLWSEQETDAVATMMEVKRKQMLLLR